MVPEIQEVKMSTYPIHSIDSAPQDSRPFLQGLQELRIECFFPTDAEPNETRKRYAEPFRNLSAVSAIRWRRRLRGA